MSEYTWNIFANPIFIKCRRARLRLKDALIWGIVVFVITAFIYSLFYAGHKNCSDAVFAEEVRHLFMVFLIIQAVILLLMGTSECATGIAMERENGVLDFHRLTPMSVVSKLLGYLFGLPVRSYFLFLVTTPFTLLTIVQGKMSLINVIHFYLIFFISIWLCHLIGLVAGLTAKKPRQGSIIAVIFVIALYSSFSQLGRLGFTPISFLTALPSFASILAKEIGFNNFEVKAMANAFGLSNGANVRFFSFYLHSTIYTLLVQGFAITSLFIAVYRKWNRESNHAFSKIYSFIFFAVIQFLLVGSVWQFMTPTEEKKETIKELKRLEDEKNSLWERYNKEPDEKEKNHLSSMLGNVEDKIWWLRQNTQDPWINAFGVSSATGYIETFMGVFFLLCGILSLVLIFVITPSRSMFVKGVRRAKKLGLPKVLLDSDSASNLLYGISFIILTCLGYFILIHLAQMQSEFFRLKSSTFSTLALPLLFAGFCLYTQGVIEFWSGRKVFIFLFLLWLIPFFTWVIMTASSHNYEYELAGMELACMISTPSPMTAFYFAVNVLTGEKWQHIDCTSFVVVGIVINFLIALLFIGLLIRRESSISKAEGLG